jgi:hypothetical protein
VRPIDKLQVVGVSDVAKLSKVRKRITETQCNLPVFEQNELSVLGQLTEFNEKLVVSTIQ